MNRDELLKALRRIKTPDEHRCFGCGYEDNCSIHGCAVIRAAMEEIMQLAVENEAMRRGTDAPARPMSQAERDAMLEWPPQPYPNPPLTLEELREMDGEPVWVEGLVKGIKSHWGIVHGNYISDGKLPNEKGKCLLLIGDTSGYDITWLAYRRKPEEGTNATA